MEVKTILIDPGSMDATSVILEVYVIQAGCNPLPSPEGSCCPRSTPPPSSSNWAARSWSSPVPTSRNMMQACRKRSGRIGTSPAGSSSTSSSSRWTRRAAELQELARCARQVTASRATSGIRSHRPVSWRLWQQPAHCLKMDPAKIDLRFGGGGFPQHQGLQDRHLMLALVFRPRVMSTMPTTPARLRKLSTGSSSLRNHASK